MISSLYMFPAPPDNKSRGNTHWFILYGQIILKLYRAITRQKLTNRAQKLIERIPHHD